MLLQKFCCCSRSGCYPALCFVVVLAIARFFIQLDAQPVLHELRDSSLRRFWISSMPPMLLVCNSSQIAARQDWFSRLRFLLPIIQTYNMQYGVSILRYLGGLLKYYGIISGFTVDRTGEKIL